MDNVTSIGTGDPSLDALTRKICQRRYPQENDFPQGSRVLVTIPLPELAARLNTEYMILLSQ